MRSAPSAATVDSATPSIKASAHRAEEAKRAAQPPSAARAPLTPTSTVAASDIDGVGRHPVTAPLNRELPLGRCKAPRVGVAPGSTSRCGPHWRRSLERTNSGDSLECGNDAVPADVTYGGDIATWVSCHLRLVAVRVSFARSGAYRRRSASTRSAHGGNAKAFTAVLEMLDA